MIIYKHLKVDSHLYGIMFPEYHGWTLTNQLLAIIADCLRWLQWAKTEDGAKNRSMPEPLERPGFLKSKRKNHPSGKGLPRSKLHQIIKRRPLNRTERMEQVRKLFSGKED